MPAISSPTTGPGPGRNATVPGGRSASAIASTRTALKTDVLGAGAHTTVFPAASAGAMTWAGIVYGQFHGVMAATTPSGRRSISTRAPGSRLGGIAPSRRSTSSAASRQ
jgi:ABC-type protease/lipase transport system fused ATPase/permease subunit